MAGYPSFDGIKLAFYEASGLVSEIEASTLRCSAMTGRKEASDDDPCMYIQEVFLAPDEAGLYSLMRAFPPSGGSDDPIGTSMCNQDVRVSYIDASGGMQSGQWKSVIADGRDTLVTYTDPTTASPVTEQVRIFNQLRLTKDDLTDPANSAHSLYADYQSESAEDVLRTNAWRERAG